jgi:phosphate starvation-inducible PhoH-like protein
MTRKRQTKAQKEETSKPERNRLVPKNPAQKSLIDTIIKNQITLINGPSGVGKTSISAWLAVHYLVAKIVDNIIIMRPVVESGESLGFLPGSYEEKLSPYMAPVLAEVKKFASYTEIVQWTNEKSLETLPFAYARGRNFHNSFVIVDEAQNCTFGQLKMVLTRIGKDSKMIINGDINQSDLSKYESGAFQEILAKLKNVDDIGIFEFDYKDIIRNSLISTILERLEK